MTKKRKKPQTQPLEPMMPVPPGYTQLSDKAFIGMPHKIVHLTRQMIAKGCTARIIDDRTISLHSDASTTVELRADEEFDSAEAQLERNRFLAGHHQVRQRLLRQRVVSKKQMLDESRGMASLIRRMTVAELFREGRGDFLRFFDAQNSPLPADALIEITGIERQRSFCVLSSGSDSDPKVSEQDEPSQDEPAEQKISAALGHECPTCHRIYPSVLALATHQRIHRQLRSNAYSISNIARLNEMSPHCLVDRLVKAGVHIEGQFVDITPEDLAAADLICPPEPTQYSTAEPREPLRGIIADSSEPPQENQQQEQEPTVSQRPEPASAPTPITAAQQHHSAEAARILNEVRQVLGPDPRVGQLEARVAELEAQLEEKSQRLQIIQQALGA